jgi:hypothetical protein
LHVYADKIVPCHIITTLKYRMIRLQGDISQSLFMDTTHLLPNKEKKVAVICVFYINRSVESRASLDKQSPTMQ